MHTLNIALSGIDRALSVDAAAVPVKPVDESAIGSHYLTEIRRQAILVLGAWAGLADDALDEGESWVDRFAGALLGVVDEDHNGELSDDEAPAFDAALEAVGDYLETVGATADDIDALMGDDEEAAESAASRLRTLLKDTMSEDDIFRDDAYNVAAGLGLSMDAVAANKRGKWSLRFRHGVKGIVKHKAKRIIRTAAQKATTKIARLKSKTGNALRLLKKSLGARRKYFAGNMG